MDAYELSCWQVLAGVDPFGEDREDWRAGIVAATVFNTAGKSFRDPRSPADYLLTFNAPTVSREDIAQRIKAGFAQYMAAQRAGK